MVDLQQTQVYIIIITLLYKCTGLFDVFITCLLMHTQQIVNPHLLWLSVLYRVCLSNCLLPVSVLTKSVVFWFLFAVLLNSASRMVITIFTFKFIFFTHFTHEKEFH